MQQNTSEHSFVSVYYACFVQTYIDLNIRSAVNYVKKTVSYYMFMLFDGDGVRRRTRRIIRLHVGLEG
jgi:hypothetical protein